LVTPGRLLELLLRPVPEHRAAWKHALRAELAGLDDPRERWSFARSCWPLPLRYALAGPRRTGVLVFAALAAAVVFDYVVHRDGPAAWLSTPLLVWYFGLLLAGTARRSPLARRTVTIGGLTALAATGAALAMTLLAPASSWEFPLAVVFVAALAAASFTARDSRQRTDAASRTADGADPQGAGAALGAPRGGVAGQRAGAVLGASGGGAARQRAGAALWAAGGVALLLPVAAFAALDLSPLWGGGGVPANGLRTEPPEARDAYAGLLLVAFVVAAALTVVTARRSSRAARFSRSSSASR
jgi:hypothetical protein